MLRFGRARSRAGLFSIGDNLLKGSKERNNERQIKPLIGSHLEGSAEMALCTAQDGDRKLRCVARGTITLASTPSPTSGDTTVDPPR